MHQLTSAKCTGDRFAVLVSVRVGRPLMMTSVSRSTGSSTTTSPVLPFCAGALLSSVISRNAQCGEQTTSRPLFFSSLKYPTSHTNGHELSSLAVGTAFAGMLVHPMHAARGFASVHVIGSTGYCPNEHGLHLSHLSFRK
jgi:hypothetical protein